MSGTHKIKARDFEVVYKVLSVLPVAEGLAKFELRNSLLLDFFLAEHQVRGTNPNKHFFS